MVGGTGYANATAVGTGNLSDLADGLGATVNITTSGGVIQSVTLNAGGLNYKAVMFWRLLVVMVMVESLLRLLKKIVSFRLMDSPILHLH